ncbi:MAG: flagellar hook-basal body complex protein FliE [Gemmatimonadetes bacterium]|nr:flagellar hook-basal body complex protein FliE [Gemmatimonadota bacterium]
MVSRIGAAVLDAAGLSNRDGPAAPVGDDEAFADVFAKALGAVDQKQTEASDLIAAFVRGEDVELHQVMAAAEEAGLALELLVEMRNKLVDAYRTIVSMQV